MRGKRGNHGAGLFYEPLVPGASAAQLTKLPFETEYGVVPTEQNSSSDRTVDARQYKNLTTVATSLQPDASIYRCHDSLYRQVYRRLHFMYYKPNLPLPSVFRQDYRVPFTDHRLPAVISNTERCWCIDICD